MDTERSFPFADGHPFGPAGQRAVGGGGGGGGPQFARPISDISILGYFPSTGSDSFAVVDEVVADDGDYIQANGSLPTALFLLTAITDPGFDTDHRLSFRGADLITGSQQIACDLYCGANLIESITLSGASTPTTVSVVLNTLNVANITDYSNLQVLIRDTGGVVKGASRRIYWIELKVGT